MVGNLIKFQRENRATLLGVGPMSRNCVDAAIEISNGSNFPLILIASRRQVDSEEFGGGYVNNWDTRSFASYVRSKTKNENLILARDHGGPWQSPVEVKNRLSLSQAMESAKLSYMRDIEAGFQILHIDPSISIAETLSIDEVIDRACELYEFCCSYAAEKKKSIEFEVGTDEQTGSTNIPETFEYGLSRILDFCKKNRFKKPMFVVAQTGTKVLEAENVGSFESPVRLKNELPPQIFVPKAIEIANKYGVMLKAHNTDYLRDDSLFWHPRIGIHSANVAPEFGVTETRSFLYLLESNGLFDLANDFLELSFNSRKWEKWMKIGSDATDRDRAIISGHYVYSSDDFKDIYSKAHMFLRKKSLDVDRFLIDSLKGSINRYAKYFRLLKL